MADGAEELLRTRQMLSELVIKHDATCESAAQLRQVGFGGGGVPVVQGVVGLINSKPQQGWACSSRGTILTSILTHTTSYREELRQAQMTLQAASGGSLGGLDLPLALGQELVAAKVRPGGVLHLLVCLLARLPACQHRHLQHDITVFTSPQCALVSLQLMQVQLDSLARRLELAGSDRDRAAAAATEALERLGELEGRLAAVAGELATARTMEQRLQQQLQVCVCAWQLAAEGVQGKGVCVCVCGKGSTCVHVSAARM